MRLFLYYASHSLLNTLKKMMKTWVVVFVIMIAFGGMIGLFGSLLDKSSSNTVDDTTIVLETDEDGTRRRKRGREARHQSRA